jgi:hypothetical protein
MSEESNKLEWQVIGQLISSIQVEQRRARRWGIFFKSITFIFLFSVLGIVISGDDAESASTSQEHLAVVDVFGPIMTGAEASAERLLPALVDAFVAPNAKAALLNINSPGGCPVQAGILPFVLVDNTMYTNTALIILPLPVVDNTIRPKLWRWFCNFWAGIAGNHYGILFFKD